MLVLPSPTPKGTDTPRSAARKAACSKTGRFVPDVITEFSRFDDASVVQYVFSVRETRSDSIFH